MSKDAVAVIEAMGIPAAQIVRQVKDDAKRATHKDAAGHPVPPSEANIAAFVAKKLQPAHFESARAWIVSTLAGAV